MSKRTLKDIPQLVELLRVEKARQKDYLAPQGKFSMKMVPGEKGSFLHFPGNAEGEQYLGIMEQAHGQIADKTGIPSKYYNRMAEGDTQDTELMAVNVNHWLGKAANHALFVVGKSSAVKEALAGSKALIHKAEGRP